MALLRSRRLETVLGAPVDELSARNIEVLAGNGVSEAFDLDFKGTLYGNSDKERRDLCGDVAALANTSGGVIIGGVEEDEHAIAAATPGVELGDAERNRMLQTLASGVAPLPALDVISVPSTDDPSRGWFVLAVPRSTRAPHAVVVNEGYRFPVRTGTT
ncbi:MAG TPA: ATP-binding protein, partial [Acidimicrobiales bacterium]